MISVHGCRSGILGNAYRCETRFVGIKKAHALAVHSNPTWNQVGFQRQSVTLAFFDARDFS
jgi:hypothetical protein